MKLHFRLRNLLLGNSLIVSTLFSLAVIHSENGNAAFAEDNKKSLHLTSLPVSKSFNWTGISTKFDHTKYENLGDWFSDKYIHGVQPSQRPIFESISRAENDLAYQVRRMLTPYGFPVLRLTIQKDNIQIFSHGAGVGDNHPMGVASVTKMFTSVAMLQLIENSPKLSLETPVRDLFKNIQATDNFLNFNNKPVTIRHLLEHSSALPYMQTNHKYSMGAYVKGHYIPGQYTTAGTQYNYSNCNYTLLMLIIEQESGIKYTDYIAMNIFRPLGMTDSRMADYSNGSSGVVSSSRDLHKFMASLFLQTETPLISEESLDEMVGLPSYKTKIVPLESYYALGIRGFVGEDGEIQSYGHAGIWTGMFADARYFPKFRGTFVQLGSPANFRSNMVGEYRWIAPHLAYKYLSSISKGLESDKRPIEVRL